MSKTYKNQSGIAHIAAIVICAVIVIVSGVGLYVSKHSNASKSVDANNNSKSQSDKNVSTKVITPEKAKELISAAKKESASTSRSSDSTQPSSETAAPATPAATTDQYGPSTKLDRPNVHPAVLKVGQIYPEYLYALQSVSQDKLQATSNKYLVDHEDYFSESFYNRNKNETWNLSLLNQSPSVDLPGSVKVVSAIMDPGDATKVKVQVGMEPNVPWSIVVVVKTSDYLGNFGYIDRLEPRLTKDPL